MANKRMFSKEIIDSDVFLDMPLSTQALYFHLAMRADDDGFVNNPRKIARMIGSNDDDSKVLITKKLILGFESGVIVIKHWKLHNYIQKDRYKKTNYSEEMRILGIKDNGAYTLDTDCVQDGNTDKIRLDKNRLEEIRIDIAPPHFYSEIVTYLNTKANTKFRSSSQKTKDLINARFKEGFILGDFKTVIDKKVSEWAKDIKMVSYLRPETLFSNKFEGYLNQVVVKSKLDVKDTNYDDQGEF